MPPDDLTDDEQEACPGGRRVYETCRASNQSPCTAQAAGCSVWQRCDCVHCNAAVGGACMCERCRLFHRLSIAQAMDSGVWQPCDCVLPNSAALGSAFVCGGCRICHRLLNVQAKDCGAWQHCDCVHYDAAASGVFMCAECRVARADPFWRATNRSLALPAKLVHAPGRPQRAGGVWDEWYSHLRREFQLPHALLEGLRVSADTQLQARACAAAPWVLCATPAWGAPAARGRVLAGGRRHLRASVIVFYFSVHLPHAMLEGARATLDRQLQVSSCTMLETGCTTCLVGVSWCGRRPVG